MAKVQLTKLAIKNIGNPKAVTMLPEGTNQLLLGTIAGVATGVKKTKMPDGVTVLMGLSGTFEGTPADPKADVISSGVCYLPDAFQGPIIDLLSDVVNADGEVAKEGAHSAAFAYEVYSIKATNPQGYSYMLKSAIEASEADPLAELRGKLAALKANSALAQIEAPVSAKK